MDAGGVDAVVLADVVDDGPGEGRVVVARAVGGGEVSYHYDESSVSNFSLGLFYFRSWGKEATCVQYSAKR